MCFFQFKDRTTLSCLFQLHTVLCSVSHSGSLAPDMQDIQNLIVDILASFTQPSLQGDQTNEGQCEGHVVILLYTVTATMRRVSGLSKSLWSLMLKDLFAYVMTSPYTFLSGLVLASELLPLPLPILSKDPLTEAQALATINQRKLWGAHLLPLSSEIGEILRNLSMSSCQPLQQLLRRVCWQLADLAAPTALLIARCLLDTIYESMETAVAEQSLETIRVSQDFVQFSRPIAALLFKR